MTPWQIRDLGMKQVIQRVTDSAGKFDQTYLTIDTDISDPTFAPGLTNPGFNGITPSELIQIALAVVRTRMIGFDVVEVCSTYDTGATVVAAARIIFEVIAQVEKAKEA